MFKMTNLNQFFNVFKNLEQKINFKIVQKNKYNKA